MRAHLVQLDIQWESAQSNYDRVLSLLDHTELSHGDLIALPEMFDSGFSLNTEKTHDRNGDTLAFLRALATDTGCMVHGSRTILDEQISDAPNGLNCATVIDPRGELVCEYHKVHPFSFGREAEAFRGGDELREYTIGEGERMLRVCPAICYDLRFPELFRKGAVGGAEMFVLGANWPDARKHHWRTLLIARAIENQAFVLGINRCGYDPFLHYAGGTIAISPKGKILGELDDNEDVLSVEIHGRDARAWREQFGALRDIRIRSF